MSRHFRIRRLRLSLIAIVAMLAACSAADEPQPMVVSTDWVAERLNDPRLVLLHVGDREVYDATHLPGARYVDRTILSTPHGDGLMLEMPSASRLKEAFEALGVSDDSRIVLYWSEEWVTRTTRAFLTLDYMGLGERTSIMDGGMQAWIDAGGVLTAEVPTVEPGSLTPRVSDDVLVDIDWVAAHVNDPAVALLDTRNTEFYTGERSGRDMRTGHIPGARTLPFNLVVDEQTLHFKNAEALEALLLAAGAEQGDRVVTYCHIGQQASLVYFVARYLGYEASMYDGSFEEWSADAGRPVETSTGI
jgi:thiosulfate/3-mercaptopyruvate sulfurtransferase